MEPVARLVMLHETLKSRSGPITPKALQEILQCSRSTVQRLVKRLRDDLGAPVVTADDGSFAYAVDNPGWELPGLWLSPDDLASLRIIDAFLERLERGGLSSQARLLRAQIGELFAQAMADESVAPDAIRSRLDIVLPGFAIDRPEIFAVIFEATMRRLRLRFADYARRRGDPAFREVSPQRLLHHRDTWFLLGWCHDTSSAGLFSLARLHHVEIQSAAAVSRPVEEASRSAVAGGGRMQRARLRFTPAAAAVVAGQIWHPEQVGQFATDGSFELRVPYVHVQDVLPLILQHGAAVIVEAPKPLRRRVIKALDAARARYVSNSR